MEGVNRVANTSLLLALLFCLLFFSSHLGSCSAAESTSTDFIKARCVVTRYPRLCIETLSFYAEKIEENPRRLAHTALSLTTTRAHSTSRLMSRLLDEQGLKAREVAVMRDCIENVGECFYELRRALREMGHLNGSERRLRISNIQTWVSAALTYYDTCTDGFTEHGIEGALRDRVWSRIDGDVQLTSNALALFNSFANGAP
ncbi:21 kDa protein-like [Aristolochia californica]|uniref:21 kDa protein-like n=1 Tax=Aristolochia californica TaxID=171875 RepID=UPI0035E0A7C2